MSDSGTAGRPELLAILAEEIRRDGPMSFARFMELSLYHPRHGYYSAGAERIGAAGDFYTASDAGTLFGECLARQLAEMDRVLGGRDPFRVVELGAGRGLLARDVMATARRDEPAFATRLRYVAVDRSPGMGEAARRNAPDATVSPELPAEAQPGCALAVELFDALPVHRVRRRDGRLREVRVDLDAGGSPRERETDPDPEVEAWAGRYGAAPEEGDEAEVSLAAGPTFERLAATVSRGFVVVVDYGHPATELYDRRHRRGTLLAYHRHGTGENYLERVGEQDLTAHVNFTVLEDRARELGLEPLGTTTQDRFLLANGLTEAFDSEDDAAYHGTAGVRRRLRARSLIHPFGMGRRFRVAVFAKDLSPAPRLRGLDDPFA